MKKLIALLAMVIFCVSLMHAENVPNPFKFGFTNTLKIRVEEDWRPGKSTSVTNDNGTSPKSDATPRYASLEETMAVSISATIAPIYNMNFGLTSAIRGVDLINNGASSSLNRALLGFVWSNKITAVKDYLDISIDAGWTVKWDMDTGAVKNLGGDDRGYGASWWRAWYPQNKIAYEMPATFGLSGKVGKTGFSWGVSQNATLLFNAQFYKDNDPKGVNHKGEPFLVAAATLAEDGGTTGTLKYGTITSAANYGDGAFGGFLESLVLTSRLQLAFEFFHFFAPANITCTLKYDHKLVVNAPISYYYEYSKEIQNDMQPSLEFGFFGQMKLGLGARIRYYTYYMESAPVNGSAGSQYLYDGSAIEVAKAPSVGAGLGNRIEALEHPNNALRVGPTVGFSVSKDWFEIGGLWYGFARDFQYDFKRDGSMNYWRNDFEIYARFKL